MPDYKEILSKRLKHHRERLELLRRYQMSHEEVEFPHCDLSALSRAFDGLSIYFPKPVRDDSGKSSDSLCSLCAEGQCLPLLRYTQGRRDVPKDLTL